MGSFSKRIQVTSNDPDHPNETLQCEGRILMPLQMSPNRVNFGSISRSSATKYQVVTLTRGDGGPIAPKVSPPKQPGLHAQVCEIEPGEHYELEVSIGPPWPRDSFRDVLKLKTGVEEAPEVAISMMGNVIPRLTAVPKRIVFPMKRTEELEKVVNLRWGDGKPANILEATTTVPGASVRIEGSERSQRLVMTVPAGSKRYPGAQTVTITTDDPDLPTFSIPVGFQREAGARAARQRGQPASARAPTTRKKTGGQKKDTPIER